MFKIDRRCKHVFVFVFDWKYARQKKRLQKFHTYCKLIVCVNMASIMQILPRDVISPESIVVLFLNWDAINSSDYKPSQMHWNWFWFISTFWSLALFRLKMKRVASPDPPTRLPPPHPQLILNQIKALVGWWGSSSISAFLRHHKALYFRK